jgi:hypothetical protein
MVNDVKYKINEMLEEITVGFIRDFLKSPYYFTHERDIHGQFYHRLLSHKNSSLLNPPTQHVPLLHLEYPHDNILKGRKRGDLDLVILYPDNSSELIGTSGDYNRKIKKMFALEFEFNDTGKDAVDHFDRDMKKLADCDGASTLLFIFMRDKTFSHEGDKYNPIYFEKLIEKKEPFNAEKFPDKIYYVNAQTKKNKGEAITATYNGIEIITQDQREIDKLTKKPIEIIDFQ